MRILKLFKPSSKWYTLNVNQDDKTYTIVKINYKTKEITVISRYENDNGYGTKKIGRGTLNKKLSYNALLSFSPSIITQRFNENSETSFKKDMIKIRLYPKFIDCIDDINETMKEQLV